MAVQGPFRVEFDDVFPQGAGVVGAVAALNDFDRSTRENRVQALDAETGLPVWAVEVMDFDPDARDKVVRVKIAAPVQPVPPEAIEGAPVRPVFLEGLQVTPYLKQQGDFSRIAYSLRATGMSAPKRRAEGSKVA